MASLVDLIMSMVTKEVMGSAATQLGESETGVNKALGGLVSTILAGIAGKAGDDKSFGDLFGTLTEPRNADILGNLGGLIGGGNLAQNDPKDFAGAMVGRLFGDKIGPILAAITAFAGLRSGSASSLLGLAGPLVMGALGKKIKDDGIGQADFRQRLISERADYERVVPPQVASLLGFASRPAPRVEASAAAPAIDKPAGRPSWFWLAPIVLGLALLAWTCSRRTADAPTTVATPAAETPVVEAPVVEEPVVAEVPVVETPVVDGGAFTRTIDGVDLHGAADGVEKRLIDFIESGKEPCTDAACWFTFDRLTFKTGSAEIDMERSAEQLTNIQRILGAFPNIQLKIGGYTDNTGSEEVNMKLSQQRAEAVAAALVSMGVGPDRVAAEGYGSQYPVAANDTEEGRAQNRRIDVRVRQR